MTRSLYTVARENGYAGVAMLTEEEIERLDEQVYSDFIWSALYHRGGYRPGAYVIINEKEEVLHRRDI